MGAATSIKDQALQRAWAAVKAPRPEQDKQGLPAATWAQMPIRTKAVLVMLGAQTVGDPREIARKPWNSISESDRFGISTCARELSQSLRNAACLF